MVAEMNIVAAELHQTTNYQLDHLMSDTKKLKDERYQAHEDLKALQSKMDTDTACIEKGVFNFENKHNTLKTQYRLLELSCDKDGSV